MHVRPEDHQRHCPAAEIASPCSNQLEDVRAIPRCICAVYIGQERGEIKQAIGGRWKESLIPRLPPSSIKERRSVDSDILAVS